MTTDPRDPATIFADALELPPGERAAFVARACGEDAGLRDEVLSLLALRTRARDAMATHALNAGVAEAARGLAGDMIGREAGPYRIESLIDVGGMGAVYRAVRGDDAFEKRVAIKVFHGAPGSAHLVERFRLERQVLAKLDHPNIARLLDGGALADGAPYIVMDYVEGVAIDRHAATLRLGISERLKLFLPVCDAIAYAHRNLVVHRDLKPGNILVDAEGAPRVLDFGIAKVLEEDGQAPDLTVTRHRMLTPRYASPEQVRGEATTTATDVYSLGVVLYELLTGGHPHAERAETDWKLAHAVTTGEPTRPSDAVFRHPTDPARLAREWNTTPGAIRRRLRGDLDTILLKALERDPARRYASVSEFAEDLRRHLEGREVQARPKTLRYRTATFVRRNKAVTVSLLAAFAVLIAGLAATTSQYLRAEQRSREARWQAYTAKLAAAESAIRSNRIEAAERFLDEAPESLRGWEWRHLRSRLDRAAHVIPAHGFWVTALAFSPDGRMLAGGSYDQSVKVWDLESLGLRHTLKRAVARSDGPAWLRGVLSMAFAPDGRSLAVGYISGFDRSTNAAGTAVVWDVAREAIVDTLRGHATWGEVALDPKTGRIAVGDNQGGVALYDGRFGREIGRFEPNPGVGTTRRVSDVIFHPRMNRLAAAHGDIEIRELEGLAVVARYPAIGEGFAQLAYDARGDRLAAIVRGGPVVLFDTTEQRPVTFLAGHVGPVHGVLLDATGTEAITAGSDGQVIRWDASSGAVKAVLRGHRSPIHSVALSPDGNTIATGDESGTIRLWNRWTDDVATVRMPQDWRPTWADAAVPAPDNGGILTAGTNGHVELWRRETEWAPEALRELDARGARTVAVSPTGDVLLVANEGGFVTVADFARRRVTRLLPAHRDTVFDVALSPDGRSFATSGADSLVRIWDLRDLDASPRDVPLRRTPTALAWAPREGPLVVGDRAGGVTLLDPSTDRVRVAIAAHDAPVTDVAIAPDASAFASASEDGTVKLWRLPGGEPIAVAVSTSRSMNSVTYSADGRRLFAGGRDALIRVLEPSTGREFVQLAGHSDVVLSLAQDRDGRLISASKDGTVRLWGVEGPEPLQAPAGHASDERDGDN